MTEEKKLTVREELNALGIESRVFDTYFLDIQGNAFKPREEQQLPDKNDFNKDQYQKITDYLTDKKVIVEGEFIDVDGFDLLHGKKYIEEMQAHQRTRRTSATRNSNGGLMPCQSYSQRGSNGGLMPCR
jgi:hypothetical protein